MAVCRSSLDMLPPCGRAGCRHTCAISCVPGRAVELVRAAYMKKIVQETKGSERERETERQCNYLLIKKLKREHICLCVLSLVPTLDIDYKRLQ